MINIKNNKTLICIYSFLQTIFLLYSFAIAKTECDGPTKFVKITVKVVTTSPPTYIYTVTNLYQSSIVNITLGSSDHKDMRIMPDNIPKVVESPKGWEGEHVFVHESEYMHIFWNVKDNLD